MTTRFDFLITGLTPVRAERFSLALSTLEALEADPVILKSEFKALCESLHYVFEDALKTLIKAPYVHNRRWETLTEAERKLEQALFMPYVHVVPGYLKKAEAFTGESPMVADILKLLREIAPLAERVLALKGKIGKRAPKSTKTSIARDDRDAKAMACQCCARRILAETGQIAHHGYERPGGGWQTASCPGALELPFEVSRDRLGIHLVAVKNGLSYARGQTAKIKSEEVPFTWTYTAKGPVAWQPVKKDVKVTRDTFAAIVAEYEETRQYRDTPPTFDALLNVTVARREAQHKREEDYLTGQQHRYDHWTQTHERRDGAWVAMEVTA